MSNKIEVAGTLGLPTLPIRHLLRQKLRGLALVIGPFAAALLISGCILELVGVSPLEYYGLVIERGLFHPRGLEGTFSRTAPLLLIGASLIVSFRAGQWNLGVDGQFLLGALACAVIAPVAVQLHTPTPVMLAASLLAGTLVGAIWALLPAVLKTYHGVSEIITTLMTTFLGISLCNVLIKLLFADPSAVSPATPVIAMVDRLPRLFGSTVTSGLLLGIIVLVITHVAMSRTAGGLKLRLLGANLKATRHAGLNVPKLMMTSFLISGALAGLAGAVAILGVIGSMRADWNPGYGLMVVPLVFLARMNGWAVIGLVFLFSMLNIGSESAAIRTHVPQAFNYALIGLLLVFMALAEYLDHRRSLRGE